MRIENNFEVPLPPAEAWKVLLDIPRIAPCMPGAELTGVVDPQTYDGKVSVKLGPVALAFAGRVKFEEIDADKLQARAKAQGKDTKGRGGANADVRFHLLPVPGGTKVVVATDLVLSGGVAQYGRASGVIQDVAAQLIGQFAQNLKAELERDSNNKNPAANDVPRAAKPISGFALFWSALRSALRRLFQGGSGA